MQNFLHPNKKSGNLRGLTDKYFDCSQCFLQTTSLHGTGNIHLIKMGWVSLCAGTFKGRHSFPLGINEHKVSTAKRVLLSLNVLNTIDHTHKFT